MGEMSDGDATDRCRVLIVEDDADQGRLIAELLRDEGLEPRVVTSGRAGLAELRDWSPRVVLLDLVLPDMDGQMFRAAHLAMPTRRDVPVIILSATSARNVRAQVELLEAAAGFEKPYDVEELLQAVLRACRQEPGVLSA
jgi:DNA-binding response OmpR family regulator